MRTFSSNSFTTNTLVVLFVFASIFAFTGTALSQKMGPIIDDGYRIGRSEEDLLKRREKLESARTVNETPGAVMTAPSNDNFANAIAVSGSGGAIHNNFDATAEPGEPIHGGGNGGTTASQNNSVWFKFIPQDAGVVRFSTGSYGYPDAVGDTVISVYAGTSVSNLSLIASNDDWVGTLYSRVTIGYQPGITYYIAVDGYMGLTGAFGFDHYVYSPAYYNDSFTNPEDLGGGIRSPYIGITGSNFGAAGQPGEPNHNGSCLPFNSIWYKWTPTVAGTYTFNTQGSEFDTILAIYQSVGGAPGPEVGSNDDFGATGVLSSRATFYADSGVTYLIAIDSYGDNWGNTLLNWAPYREEGGKKYDFDGDSKTDISIFRPINGQWWVKRSTSGHFALTFGNVSDKQTPADFTGDGKVDIAFWRPSTGYWYILRSEDNSFYSFPFGTAGDIPTTGRFDNDAKTDPVIYRPSTGVWYKNLSRTSLVNTVSFGLPGDVPVPADYDGDGITDIGIFRPSNGQWWINRSRSGLTVATFGTSSDLPVPGAYSGHGYANVAFWRPSTGEWFVLVNPSAASYYSFPFGTSTDLPAPGDFDGDGKFDAAVFRPSNATWYINRTGGAGTLIEQFGASSDRPVPGSYIP